MHPYKKYLESEEMQFYLEYFGFKPNPTVKKIKSWTKQKLLEELKLIENKASDLSKKERDLVVYFSQKIK